jgi:hypothetical protein
VDFGLQFQAMVPDGQGAPHDEAENDAPDTPAATSEDGSNVVTVDFGKRK